MKLLLIIALGSALGGVCRFSLDGLVFLIGEQMLPLGTLIANVGGSFCIGWIAGLWSSGVEARPLPMKYHFAVTGFCGGFTTFSTYVWEVLEMIRSGGGQFAGFYAAGSIGLGVVSVWLGVSLAYHRKKRVIE